MIGGGASARAGEVEEKEKVIKEYPNLFRCQTVLELGSGTYKTNEIVRDKETGT